MAVSREDVEVGGVDERLSADDRIPKCYARS